MQNKWKLWGLRVFPFLILLVFMCLQYLFIQQTLYFSNKLNNQQYETLKERMREDNVPFEIQDHISYVFTNSSFSINSLFSSMFTMQVLFQTLLFTLFYSFYLMMIESKFKKEPEKFNN